ncbi:MAG: penicillin-binding protein 1B [Gammaproteobacteria bacterium]|nr:MAG: penicillin-binding protein 1B [Gammaproteobacteria bacterium]
MAQRPRGRRRQPTRKKSKSRKTTTTRKSSRKQRRTRRRKGSLWRWLAGLLVLGVVTLGGYTLYLSHQVRVAFEGKRWAVPARVYARPLELYEGAALTPAQLRHELQILGYRKVRCPGAGAQWSGGGRHYRVRTRAFHFWDGEQPPLTLDIRLADGQVSRLTDGQGRPLDIVRLEPAEIGSIYPTHREDRVLVRREDLPDSLVQALLAVEDRRFFEHHGIDPRGIARALWNNLRAGGVVQGGSTLTQQLVKNFFLTPERSLWRKFNEALMALIVEARYSKDEILEAYANEVYLGQDGARAIHGFGLASYFYFNRPLQELRLHETALLAGLVKGASYYNPRRHPDRALKRRNLVLEQMQKLGFITAAQARRAKAQPLGVTGKGHGQQHRYPAFIQLVRRQLARDYREEDLTSEGLRIFTTLDPWVQKIAVDGVARELARIEKSRRLRAGILQAAMVIVSPQGGEVTALIGGRKAGVSGFNRALDARRPVGSLVKPAVYLTALARPRRFTLATLIEDKPVRLELPNGDLWTPQNFDHKLHGRVPLHRALAQSLNLATVNLGLELRLEPVIQTLHELGVDKKIRPYPSLLLGAIPMAPVEVAQIYQTLAAGGFRAPLRAIREVLDADGQPLQRYPLEVRQVVDPVPAFLLTSNLQEVVQAGTANGLKSYLGRDFAVAGKTGTTNDLRDSWFAGFGGDRVAVVWVGRDDNKPTGLTGSRGALPVFGRVMRDLHLAPLDPLPPTGVRYYWVEESTGLLSAEGCEGAIQLPFAEGSEPKRRSRCAASGTAGLLERLFGG